MFPCYRHLVCWNPADTELLKSKGVFLMQLAASAKIKAGPRDTLTEILKSFIVLECSQTLKRATTMATFRFHRATYCIYNYKMPSLP